MSNAEHFNNGEGDAFYRRNRDALDAYRFDEDPLAKMILASGIKPSYIVDVGCANGKRLLGLCRTFKVNGMGIDPSHDAIAAATKMDNSTVTWRVGDADLPLGRPPVNALFLYSFVLHWMDRGQMARTMAGWFSGASYVAIQDFYPKEPTKNHYHHLPDERVWTYKRQYSDLFMALGSDEFERIAHEVVRYDIDDMMERALIRRK